MANEKAAQWLLEQLTVVEGGRGRPLTFGRDKDGPVRGGLMEEFCVFPAVRVVGRREKRDRQYKQRGRSKRTFANSLAQRLCVRKPRAVWEKNLVQSALSAAHDQQTTRPALYDREGQSTNQISASKCRDDDKYLAECLSRERLHAVGQACQNSDAPGVLTNRPRPRLPLRAIIRQIV